MQDFFHQQRYANSFAHAFLLPKKWKILCWCVWIWQGSLYNHITLLYATYLNQLILKETGVLSHLGLLLEFNISHFYPNDLHISQTIFVTKRKCVSRSAFPVAFPQPKRQGVMMGYRTKPIGPPNQPNKNLDLLKMLEKIKHILPNGEFMVQSKESP